MPIEVYSFFSGIGFLDLGFEDAGFDIVFANEINDRFLKAYQYARKNRKHAPRYGYSNTDVKEFLSDELWKKTFPDYGKQNEVIKGFIGGPPCPDFSTAGRNEGENGENGHLTTVYVNLIIKRQPDFFVFENVKGLYQTKKHRDYYEKIKKRLYKAGYTLFDSIENAVEYGTPQFRERLILLGFKRASFGKKIKYKIGNKRKYDLASIIEMPWPTETPFIEEGILCKPEGICEELTVQYWFEKNDVNNHPNGNDFFNTKNKERFLSVPEGKTKGKSFKRLHRWRYSPTAAYGNNEVHLHPYKPRRISVAEALAIQSLPADFILPSDMPLSAKYKMVANGVPYLLSYGIAKELFEWISVFSKKSEE